jgi:hypothetical protein
LPYCSEACRIWQNVAINCARAEWTPDIEVTSAQLDVYLRQLEQCDPSLRIAGIAVGSC